MKRVFLCFLLMCCFVTPVISQTTVELVDKAIKAGSASELAKQFDKIVDITINNEQSTYSKSQAEMVLKNFFIAHAVSSFQAKHQGKPSDNNSIFIIGDLNTKDNKRFRIYLYFKKKSGKFLLQEIRFEE